MKRLAMAVSMALGLTGCPDCTGVLGIDDAGTGPGHDASNTHHDGSSQQDGSLIRDGSTPDVVAEVGGYAVTNADGTPLTQHSDQSGDCWPDGDSQSSVVIDPFAGNTTFIPGGTNSFSGSVSGDVVSILVGFVELPNYQFDVPVNNGQFGFYITLGQNVNNASLTLVLVPVLRVSESQPGGCGQALSVRCTVVQVGTGDLQVSLSWATDTDVDLHLEEPSGEDIYYGHRTSANGGTLDLDANAGCDYDQPRVDNENITYQNANPPNGHYIVRVDYWSACTSYGTSASTVTNYTVTVNIRGTPTVYQGSFVSGDEDYGDSGSGRVVAEFDF